MPLLLKYHLTTIFTIEHSKLSEIKTVHFKRPRPIMISHFLIFTFYLPYFDSMINVAHGFHAVSKDMFCQLMRSRTSRMNIKKLTKGGWMGKTAIFLGILQLPWNSCKRHSRDLH